MGNIHRSATSTNGNLHSVQLFGLQAAEPYYRTMEVPRSHTAPDPGYERAGGCACTSHMTLAIIHMLHLHF